MKTRARFKMNLEALEEQLNVPGEIIEIQIDHTCAMVNVIYSHEDKVEVREGFEARLISPVS